MYAIIRVGGKQYRVEEGKFFKTEKLDGEKGDALEFSEVMAINKDGELITGKPYVEGAKVVGKILEQGKENKLTVFKYKPKKDYSRKSGHRQLYTKVLVERIEVPS